MILSRVSRPRCSPSRIMRQRRAVLDRAARVKPLRLDQHRDRARYARGGGQSGQPDQRRVADALDDAGGVFRHGRRRGPGGQIGAGRVSQHWAIHFLMQGKGKGAATRRPSRLVLSRRPQGRTALSDRQMEGERPGKRGWLRVARHGQPRTRARSPTPARTHRQAPGALARSVFCTTVARCDHATPMLTPARMRAATAARRKRPAFQVTMAGAIIDCRSPV